MIRLQTQTLAKKSVDLTGEFSNQQGLQARRRAERPARPVGGMNATNCREIKKWWAR